VFAPIVRALAQSGRYDEAKEASRRIQSQNEQASALRTLACTLAHAGYFDPALETARSIQPASWRVAVLQSLALIMHQKGDERGSATFDEVRQIIDRSENSGVKADRLLSLVSTLLRVGDERAESLIPEALEAARSEEEDEFRAENLHKLALTLAQAGDPRAESVFREALAATENVPTEDGYQWAARTGVASAMAEAHYIAAAFAALDGYSTEVLETIVSWHTFIDAFQPHLSIQIIQHSLRIMGWVFPDWHEIHELLSG
jgi:tetratricopeptide (TPR) repeat protein